MNVDHDQARSVPIDGNALGGELGAYFGRDLTAAQVTCTDCRREQVVAQLVVYTGPGMTARCRGCGSVVMRTARVGEDLVFDLRGATMLRVTAPEPQIEATTQGLGPNDMSQ